MHLSISSSNQRLPHLAWKPILIGALLLFVTFVAVMEWRLAAKGFRQSIADSEALWQAERERARFLGKDALILIGGSRIQLGIDLDVLRQLTGLEPVQLAIDGTPPIPILEGLAHDSQIRGTVMVDYYDYFLAPAGPGNQAVHYEARFAQTERRRMIDYNFSENYLTDHWRRLLRSYADGTRPLTALFTRVFGDATPQYLITLWDRSRLADYSLVSMPDFYYRRVIRNLGQEIQFPAKTTYADVEQTLRSRIAEIKPADNTVYTGRLDYLESLVRTIQARGGKVFFVVMPSSGLVREIEQRSYPKPQFWDRLVNQTSAHTVHFEDFPVLRGFKCPDGSHLDYRDRARFTAALVDAAGLGRR